eukprot:CAMPEP_0201492106 /NCGR_PEP_ID=MMETSP0151_2-20130828/32080_1 /ASSEMBLY_ACC=CAM_ASM_000257 /TAXON_ID=200890 /ORGANISM="Paramoeba atlantica, Strain 621/1 / CCAP 1560/9" /LENGTH=118 /DNA_ID=CAMNT_0047878769 /DNA_START=617 /DNA_END=973 /DNA_ORIENTATION=-
MAEKWRSDADFIVIYIEEAHPTDGWFLGESSSAVLASHASVDERVKAVKYFAEQIGGLPCPLYIDTMKNCASTKYGGFPERLHIIEDGKIVMEGGVGPFNYFISDVENWLEKRFKKKK